MKIQITIDTETDAGQSAVLATLARVLGPAREATSPPVKLAPPTIVTEAIEEMRQAEPKVVKTKKAEKSAKKTETTNSQLTFAEIQKKAKALIKAGKREEFKAARSDFGIQELAELDEGLYAEFGSALEALMEG